MYAVIVWNMKNGVALGREELEVMSTSKLTVMNGGKMATGSTVNMQFRKDIWGGRIQSLHADKKDADKQLERELTGSTKTISETLSDEVLSTKSQRKRKKKSYGMEFEEDSISGTEENSDLEPTSSGLEEKKSPAKKAKKTSATSGGKRNTSKKDRERAISAQHDELVITEILRSPLTPAPAHPQFGGKEPKQHKPPKCISVVCKEEKERLQKKLEDVTETLQNTKRELLRFQEELRILKAKRPAPSDLDTVKYGKLPRSVGEAQNWEEISNGVWCCPVKVKAAVKNASSRTGLALALFGFFYPKEELSGKRLHELDQDVIEAITDFAMVAKLTKDPKPRKLKDGKEEKPLSPVTRSGIKQALRVKCNSVICNLRKKGDKTSAEEKTEANELEEIE